MHRRDFLKSSAAASFATLSALTAAGAADRPNDKIVVAFMGIGKGMNGKQGRGLGQIKRLGKGFEDVEVAYICDVDENLVPEAVQAVTDRQKKAPKVEKDIRNVLKDKDVNAVFVMTPDHWHGLATVWACQHGKHVYVEKPVSHNYREGQTMVEAARKYNCVVQGGTQRRTATHFKSAAEYIRSGKLGKVPFARTWIAGNRPSIGHKPDAATPKGVDYDLWLGPAPKRPFNPNRFHYEWHWDWDLGTGELGNNGIHALDGVRMVLGLDAPVRITSGGGKLFYDDDRITPDTQVVTFDFPNTCVMWEHRIWSKTGIGKEAWGIALYGEKGTLMFDKEGWKVIDGKEDSDKAEVPDPSAEHMRNFFDCIKATSGKSVKLPNADIEESHKSTRLCHLGNIAYRLNHVLRFDGKTETVIDDVLANKMFARSYRDPFVVPDKV